MKIGERCFSGCLDVLHKSLTKFLPCSNRTKHDKVPKQLCLYLSLSQHCPVESTSAWATGHAPLGRCQKGQLCQVGGCIALRLKRKLRCLFIPLSECCIAEQTTFASLACTIGRTPIWETWGLFIQARDTVCGNSWPISRERIYCGRVRQLGNHLRMPHEHVLQVSLENVLRRPASMSTTWVAYQD